MRWGEGYARVAELAGEMPQTRLVYVADREADLRELMERARDLGTPAEGLLRCKHNRALPAGGRLWAKVLESPLLEPEEWQAAYILAKKPLPKQPPRLSTQCCV